MDCGFKIKTITIDMPKNPSITISEKHNEKKLPKDTVFVPMSPRVQFGLVETFISMSF